jgi:hypothetical protein
MDALLGGIGSLFASGIGILVLAALGAAIVILWDWRLALAGVVVLTLGLTSILVYLHGLPGPLALGQVMAVALSALILGGAKLARSSTVPLRHASNLPLRLLALLFVLGGWWFIDPGYTFPLFSQAETDFLLWMLICGLAMASFTTSPFFVGIALLLWSMPVFAVAAILLPGSGLSVLVGIVDLLLALACAYLVLTEQVSHVDVVRGLALPVLPPARQSGASAATAPAPGAASPPKRPRSNPLLKRPT